VKLKSGIRISDSGVALGSSLVFSGITEVGSNNNFNLWITDGTAAGTKPIANLRVLKLFNFGNAVYFFADGKANQQDLWKTDGTTKGTKLVKAGFGIGNKVAVTPDSFYFFNGASFGTVTARIPARSC